MWQQWVNVLLGLWVIAVPFTGMAAVGMMWTLVISGILIAAFGLWGAAETSAEREEGKMMHRAHT